MPKLTRILPVARLHKPSGQARVILNKKEIYLGKWGSPEAKAKYDQVITEWLVNQRHLPTHPPELPTHPPQIIIDDILSLHSKHALVHYRDSDGNPTGEAANFQDANRELKRLYGKHPVGSFGPMELRDVREAMIRAGLARTTINARVNKIRHVFKWAVSMGLVQPVVLQGLQTLQGLQAGRSKAKEPPKVKPAYLPWVEATLPHLPEMVAAMVRIQILTGCRVGELFALRASDLKMEGDVWEYCPGRHKNSHRGQSRTIFLGPRAIELVRPFLPTDPKAKVFAYDRRSYRQAIVRAAKRAGVPTWTPLQLRHARADQIERLYGAEASRTVLGHASLDTTQIYLTRDLDQAREIMRAIG